MDLVLGRDGKSKGERLNDSLIAKRQRYLEALSVFESTSDEAYRLSRVRDKAEDAFKIALRDFDEYYGVKK